MFGLVKIKCFFIIALILGLVSGCADASSSMNKEKPQINVCSVIPVLPGIFDAIYLGMKEDELLRVRTSVAKSDMLSASDEPTYYENLTYSSKVGFVEYYFAEGILSGVGLDLKVRPKTYKESLIHIVKEINSAIGSPSLVLYKAGKAQTNPIYPYLTWDKGNYIVSFSYISPKSYYEYSDLSHNPSATLTIHYNNFDLQRRMVLGNEDVDRVEDEHVRETSQITGIQNPRRKNVPASME